MSFIFPDKWFKGAQASVVLRRQVPIRFDEPARSWLGGLPQMPGNIPWPRTYKGAPLHFIAQIACGDLPKQTWSGRGPRDGWLLLFVDVLEMEDDSEGFIQLVFEALQKEDDGEGRLVRVLHVDRLGPERQPPDDMPTVRHAMSDYIGRFEPEIRDGVPKLWRRWPVDLVVQQVPAPPSDESGWEPAEVTGAELYGAPEDEENIDHFAAAEPRPLTWRGALYLVETLLRDFSKNSHRGGRAKVWEPGWLARSIAKLEASVLQHAAGVADATTKLQCAPEAPPEVWDRLWQYLCYQRVLHSEVEQRLAELARLSRQMPEDALAAEIARADAAHMSWLDMQRSELEHMRRHILTQDLDALMGDESWAAMKAKMIAAETEYWMGSDPEDLRKIRTTLLDYADHGLKFALREDLLDLYTRSAAARASIPEALRAELEPKLRNIYRATTPHRMGGPRELLQNCADPDDDDLLFQIGSDYAMGWMWGDLGALFVYLSPVYLKMRWFKRADARIDGH
jgi:uncharacterized protein YwqG